MRVPRPRAPALVSVAALLVGLAGLAVAAEIHTAPGPPVRARVTDAGTGAGAVDAGAGAGSGGVAGAEPVGPGVEAARDRKDAGASCRILAQGSVVTAHCHNPYPRTDRVRLHVECARWWDLDTDSAPTDVDPADFAQVTGRCWKEIRSAWVTHEPAAGGS